MTKQLFFFVSFLLFSFASSAQSGYFEEAVMDSVKQEVERQAEHWHIILHEEVEDNPADKDAYIEFMIDTFRVEYMMELLIEHDGSTSGMSQATGHGAKGYDALLNKYYKKLMDVLEGKDKEVLRDAQRRWIAYRDAELQLIYKLSEEKYSGGGSIQRIIVAGKRLDLTKKRVLELYDHYQIW